MVGDAALEEAVPAEGALDGLRERTPADFLRTVGGSDTVAEIPT